MTVNELVEHVEITIQAGLGESFSKLTHVNDISKNKYKNAAQRFGVLIDPSSENTAVLGQYYIDQEIEVVLTNQYKVSEITSDLDQRTKAIILTDKSKNLFKKIVMAPMAGLRQVKDLSIKSPEYDTKNHTVIQRFTFVMTYK